MTEIATSYDWVDFRPLGAGFGLAVPVIDGGAPEEDVVDPVPDDDEDEDDEVPLPLDDALLPPEVVLPALDAALALLEPLSALTALCAMLATLATLPKLGVVVDDAVARLPLAVENGLRPRPVRCECAGVDWTLSAGSVLAAGGGGAGAGVCV